MHTTLNYFRSRSEQLADHLREGIARGEITEPLPVARTWSKALNVSRFTLQQALSILRREKLLSFRPRHPPHLKTVPGRVRKPNTFRFRIARMIVHSRALSYRLDPEWTSALFLRLSPQNIHLAIEVCSHARIKAISRRACPPNEVLLLWSLPSAYHAYFSRWTRNALILGHPAPDSPLSHIAADLDGSIRHAARSLMRKGFSRISLLTDKDNSQGVLQAIRVFEKTCREWPRQPIVADCRYLSMKTNELRAEARRFAGKMKPRHGIIIMQPSFVTMIVSALAERSHVIPRDAEIYALSTGADGVRVCPSMTFYPFPIDAVVRSVAEGIFHFFETGSLPRMRKTVPLEADQTSVV